MKWVKSLAGHKVIIYLLIVTLIVPTVLYGFVYNRNRNQAATYPLEGATDKQIVTDISNMTGVSSDKIVKLKETGLSWNEVLEQVKSVKGTGTSGRKARSALLTEENMEETTAKLRESGFEDRDIQEAKLSAERIAFQLSELTDDSAAPSLPAAPAPQGLSTQKTDARAESIAVLAKKFDSAALVYYLLVLSGEFDGPETISDEYLLSLQLELDLQQYIDDPEAYLKSKQEKSAILLPGSEITTAYIEETVLTRLNQGTAAESGKTGTSTPAVAGDIKSSLTGNAEATSARESSPIPEVPNVQPVNPSEKIQQELDALNPNLP